MTDTFTYLAQCSICDQGLVRVRTIVQGARMYPICQCDECDASWKDPSLEARLTREDTDRILATCDQNYWSLFEEICLFGWAGFVRTTLNNHTD